MQTATCARESIGMDPTNVDDYESGVLRVFQSKEETKAFYNKIAGVYDLLSEHAERPMREKGLAMLSAQPGENILEIGFGTGHCLVNLAKSVGAEGRVYGIDISERMVALADELMARESLSDRVELTCGEAEFLPYRSESLDAIFTSSTLELFDTPKLPEVLKEWKRVLKPGGRLAVVSLSKVGDQGLVMKTYEWSHKHFPNLIDCRPIYVEHAVAAADFTAIEVSVDHMWVPVEIVLAGKSTR